MSTRSIRTRSSHRRAALAIASEKAFVAAGSHLVEFLDTVSLARFTATSKEYRPLLDLEVARRKAKIQEYEERVKQLIGCEGEEPESYVRANVEAAKKLCQAAMHLIRCGPYFLDQRAKFVPPRTSSLDGEHRSPLSMLPTILYLPKTGEPVHPDKGAIDEMERVANFWWKLETNGLQSVVGVDFFHDLVCDIASKPVRMEAFRSAARKIVWGTKHAQPCLTHALQVAGEIMTEMDAGVW